MHSLDFDQLAQDCRKLSDALTDLPEKLANVAEGMRVLGKAGAAANSLGGSGGGKGGRGGFFGALWNFNKAILSVRFFANTISSAIEGLGKAVSKAGSYVEDMNLFATSMGEYGQQAYDYAQKVHDALGIDMQEWLRNQGTLMTMATGMGVASDNAALMSQQLTQLAYDISSYQNISVDKAFEKVQAGLAGQLRPLRELGYDLSEAALREYALAHGITQSTDSMTQAEKSILRYNMMIENVTESHGDLARTINSPMNQLRLLQAAISEAGRAWASIFLPAAQAVMNVLIPLARVLATIGNMLAALTCGTAIMSSALADLGGGGNYSSTVSGLQDTANAATSAGNAASGAADSYEELDGYRLRFGLTWVDHKTGQRKWKKSRYYFSEICKTHMVDL